MKTEIISVKQGVNRIKLVGYDAPYAELKMHIEDGRYITN